MEHDDARAARTRILSPIGSCAIWAMILLTFNIAATVLADEFNLTHGESAHFTATEGLIRFDRERGVTLFPDPRCPNSASLRITTSAYDSGDIVLPCTGWTFLKNRYVYKDDLGLVAGVTWIEWK